MNNDIIKFLNIIDDTIETIKIDEDIDAQTKNIHLRKKYSVMICPDCGCRMYSKGIYIREINHPIFQDGYKLYLTIYQRKWNCTNKSCNTYLNDEFPFVEKYKQSTILLPFLVLDELKDINATSISVSKRYNISDNTVRNIFKQYVDLPRLKLSEAISVDEVYMHFDNKNLYSLIIVDFITGEIIDLLQNRLDKTTSRYFYSISIEERNKVKYLICDMYNPYINYVNKYFHNAICIVDSFHVIQWIENSLRSYVNALKKKYKDIEAAQLAEKNMRNNRSYKTSQSSDELYLLNNFSFFLFSNDDNIKYDYKKRYNKKFKMYLNTYDLENMFFNIDPNLKKYSDLKQIYHDFNKCEYSSLDEVKDKLEYIIIYYKKTKIKMFMDFANLLTRHKEMIINSFIKIDVVNENGEFIQRRLSNGPTESINNIPKDYKRISNGVSDFNYTRNRILWATRLNPVPLGVPKKLNK